MTAPTPEEFERHLHEGPTLPEFTLARVAEDEAWAHMAQDASDETPWSIGSGPIKGDVFTGAGLRIAETRSSNTSRHIAAHDPARVLAQCAAYRRIMDALEDERQRKDIYNRDYDLGLLTTNGDLRNRLSANARWAGLDVAAQALAAIWADHEDYPEERKL